jgi:MFS transporter, FSR family, fosmidomycin resistance protein
MSLMSKTLKLSNQPMLLTGSSLVAFLAVVHLASDAVTNIFSALLPTFQHHFGVTETILALLVATLAFSSSVTQPLFGALADRLGHRRVGALGVILNAGLLSLIGVVPTLYLLFGLLLIGGLGSAALHPAIASIARAAGRQKGELAVSLFSAGGTVGVALGPVIVLFLVSSQGLNITPWLMIPGVILGGLMYILVPSQEERPSLRGRAKLFDLRLLLGPVGLLSLTGILSSVASVTFNNAMPLWLVQRHGLAYDTALIGWILAAFSLSAALGGIIAGMLSRRMSHRLLITGSILLALAPLFAIFYLEPSTLLFFLAVMLAGALLNAGLPLMVVSAQDLAPHSAATASGMLMGFTIGVAGILYIGIGRLQELIGLTSAMSLSYLSLIPAALLAFYVLTKYPISTVEQAPVDISSCLCSPGLGANIGACPCRAGEGRREECPVF